MNEYLFKCCLRKNKAGETEEDPAVYGPTRALVLGFCDADSLKGIREAGAHKWHHFKAGSDVPSEEPIVGGGGCILVAVVGKVGGGGGEGDKHPPGAPSSVFSRPPPLPPLLWHKQGP